MKKITFLTILIFLLGFAFPIFSFAHDTSVFSSSLDNATIQSQQQEEQEGKKFLDDLNNKTITCSQFKDADFEKIGEYFMGQSIGDISRHIAMNEMMKGMMGEQGEEQAHIAMGKRMSNCEPDAPMPQSMMGTMMGGGMMGGSGSPMFGNFGVNSMGWFGWIFMLLFWVLIIAGIIALIKWIMPQSGGSDEHKNSPFKILKERYAKGEIDKKEFEEKKKDLI